MSLSRNASYNLAGTLLPVVLTLVTVPLYLEVAGPERYGVLALCWVILGYIGFLDLGLGPAVAYAVASAKDGTGDGPVIWTALWVSLAAGLAGAVIILVGAELYFDHMADVDAPLARELDAAMPLLAVIAPIVLVSSIFSGALQGRSRFLAINVSTAASSTLMSLLPLILALLWTPSLTALLTGAIAARALGLLMLAVATARASRLAPLAGIDRARLAPLLRFGGWVSLSSIVQPLLLTLDRLAIGVMFGPAAVAAYTIPNSLVSRLGMLPASLSAALFPRLAGADEAERARLAAIGIPAIAATMTPAAVLVAALAEPFFLLWIGAELAAIAVLVALILTGGMWVAAFASIPSSVIQASGRPDLIAKLRLAELLPYWLILFLGLSWFGILGAAAAFALRSAGECVALFIAARIRPAALALPVCLVAAALLAAGLIEPPLRHPVLAMIVVVTLAWSIMAMPVQMRSALKNAFAAVRRSRSASRRS